MNKNELIGAVASSAGISKTQASDAVEAVFGSISTELSSGGEVRLVGFGTFMVADRKATTGRNPRTGEQIQIGASQKVKFLPAKTLKEVFNNFYHKYLIISS